MGAVQLKLKYDEFHMFKCDQFSGLIEYNTDFGMLQNYVIERFWPILCNVHGLIAGQNMYY